MYQSFAVMALRRLCAVTLLLFSVVDIAYATELTIEEAGMLALKDDYTLQAISARSDSMSEMSVASGRLPDPKLKMGFANVPTDSFDLDQDPMSQAVIGIHQSFPRGRTRTLRSERIDESVARNDAEAEDRQHLILLAVREEYTRLFLQQERQKILQQSLILFTDLAEITREYFASGRAHQQDVVQAQLELSRVKERLLGIQQQEEQARARLAERIGANAYRQLDSGWPEVGEPPQRQQIISNLAEHPRLRAWQHEIAKQKTSEEIARQAYKPGFAVDLAYGARSSRTIDGAGRSDLLSVFVTMDIPLFRKNRQDRVLAASIADTSATEYVRDDVHRTMKARVEEHAATLVREQERLGLYQEFLLPQAAFNAEAAFEGYQDAVDDLTSLMRARIGEYELKLSHAALRADEIITRARLLYFYGETS